MELPDSVPVASKDAPKRTRVSIACNRCSTQHIRCDGGIPCSTCKKKHLECQYSKKGKRGPKQRAPLPIGGVDPVASEGIYNRSIFMELAAAFQTNINDVFETVPSPDQLSLEDVSTPEQKFVMAAIGANGWCYWKDSQLILFSFFSNKVPSV